MTHELALADRAYSSWSLRAWLLVDHFDLPVECRFAHLRTADFTTMMEGFAPARTVPALRLPEGPVIAESLAIAEELAARFPAAGLWPSDPKARAVARALAAEMHAGFGALRAHCPMNLRRAYRDVPLPEAVQADLVRISTIWSWARQERGGSGPWLCGAYSVADAFFAPVAARIAGHALHMPPADAAYVGALLGEASFRRWFDAAQGDGPDQTAYDKPWPQVPWPVNHP